MKTAQWITLLLAVTPATAQDRMTVQIFNTAPQSATVLTRAEAETTWLFRKAGIVVDWVNCQGLPGIAPGDACKDRQNSFVIVIRGDNSPGVAGETALGFAFPQIPPGNHGAVLYPRIARLASETGAIDEATLFAHTLAHELGHLLLGDTRHRSTIMKAHWHEPEFKLMSEKRFLFTRDAVEQMRAGLRRRATIDVARR